MKNFSLIRLVYTKFENIILCEQKGINELKPEYILNPIIGSCKGYTHTQEAIEKKGKADIGRWCSIKIYEFK